MLKWTPEGKRVLQQGLDSAGLVEFTEVDDERRRLEAERDNLTEINAAHRNHVTSLEAENERLDKEIDAYDAGLTKAKAEIERLTRHLENAAGLEEKCERLRAALENITFCHSKHEECRAIARAALDIEPRILTDRDFDAQRSVGRELKRQKEAESGRSDLVADDCGSDERDTDVLTPCAALGEGKIQGGYFLGRPDLPVSGRKPITGEGDK